MDRDMVELLETIMEKYRRACDDGWTPDGVHDYRVAIRRTRSYLKFWRGESPRRQRQFQARLRMMQRQTAFVREWDVFRDQFQDTLPDEAIKKGEFARYVQIQGWSQLKATWLDLLEEGKRLKGQPPKDLQDRLRRQTILEAEKEEIDWHRLRIRVKRLRYEMERHKRSSEEAIRSLKAWQDQLGMIQDANTHQKWFAWLGEDDSMVSLGNQTMRAKLMEEAERDLPNLKACINKGTAP